MIYIKIMIHQKILILHSESWLKTGRVQKKGGTVLWNGFSSEKLLRQLS